MSKRKTINAKTGKASTPSKLGSQSAIKPTTTKTTKSVGSTTKRLNTKSAKTLNTNNNEKPIKSKVKANKTAKFAISHEQRTRMIEEAAYYYSLSDNPLNSMDNWLKAERDIDTKLSSSRQQ